MPSHANNDERLPDAPAKIQGSGRSMEVPAASSLAKQAFSSTGAVRLERWREGAIPEPGLEGSDSALFAAMEMTRMPMIVTDPNLSDNPIVFANGAFLDLTGYAQDEIIGRNCRFLQGAQTDRQVVRDIREALEARRAVTAEILNYRRDGTPFWNALFIAPIFDAQGRLLYFFASQLDVTPRRAAEAAFRQEQKMEAIGQLTAGLAHDFNNLLQVIAGNIETAQIHSGGEGDPARLARALENADRAARRATKLTQQLLAFARKSRLEPKPTNLNALIVALGEMLSRALGEGVDLRLDLTPRCPPCALDAAHLETALLNVLVNARDAMPEGGVVTLSTEPLHLDGDAPAHPLPPGDYVCLSIKDEGQGMTPDVLERAAEPFFSTKGPGKGTGLGLAMVHGFVRQSGGRLDIESAPGRGTTVRMLFPVAADSGAAQPHPLTRGGEPPRGPETILVVDDSDDVRDLAVNILQDIGYRTLAARGGEEALRIIARETRIDLLFTDLAMPGDMNGLVLAAKARERHPGLPVLLTTGYTEELVREGPPSSGMDVLGKPYRRSELADRVRAALNRRGLDYEPRPIRPRHEG